MNQQFGEDERQWYFHAGCIVLVSILFWPCGISLLSLRLNRDHCFHGAGARLLQMTGALLALFASVGILFSDLLQSGKADFPEPTPVSLYLGFLILGSIFMGKKGISLQRFSERRQVLLDRLANSESFR